MLKFRRFVSVSHSYFKLCKVTRNSENVSNRIIWLSRIVSNSGCLVAGCCFSKQSDEETLLPETKNNYGTLKTETADYSFPRLNTRQNVSYSKTMKRSFETLDVVTDEHSNADVSISLVSDTPSKRNKTVDNENDIVEEKQSITVGDSHTNESTVLPPQVKFETPKVQIKKSKAEIKKPKRPNYFVAVQISDDKIHQALNELQSHMLGKDERLKKSLIQLSTLHITLMVMHIGDSETHARAMKALENIHKEHDEDFSKNPLKLEFKGLSNFQNRVLYAKLLTDDSYKRLSLLVESVKKHFLSFSISSTDHKTEFTPHLTIAKIRGETRKFKKQDKPLKKIVPALYEDFNDRYFGCQTVQSIQLLSMTGPKDEAGYYPGKEIYFSAFEPKLRRDSLSKMLETEEKKKSVKEIINALAKDKLK